MKKTITLFAFLPIFSSAQKIDTFKVKPKFQYIQVNLLPEQYDTINYAISKTMVEHYPYATSALRIWRENFKIINIYDSAEVSKLDTVKKSVPTSKSKNNVNKKNK